MIADAPRGDQCVPGSLRRGDVGLALADMDKAVELQLNTNDWDACLARIALLVRMKQYETALWKHQKYAEANPRGGENEYAESLLRVQAGDAKAYQNLCRELLERYKKDNSPPAIFWLVAVSRVSPFEDSDSEQVMNIGGEAAA